MIAVHARFLDTQRQYNPRSLYTGWLLCAADYSALSSDTNHDSQYTRAGHCMARWYVKSTRLSLGKRRSGGLPSALARCRSRWLVYSDATVAVTGRRWRWTSPVRVVVDRRLGWRRWCRRLGWWRWAEAASRAGVVRRGIWRSLSHSSALSMEWQVADFCWPAPASAVTRLIVSRLDRYYHKNERY